MYLYDCESPSVKFLPKRQCIRITTSSTLLDLFANFCKLVARDAPQYQYCSFFLTFKKPLTPLRFENLIAIFLTDTLEWIHLPKFCTLMVRKSEYSCPNKSLSEYFLFFLHGGSIFSIDPFSMGCQNGKRIS